MDKPTYKQKFDAYDDIWKFFALIQYNGGIENFGTIHHEVADFISSSESKRKLLLIPREHLKTTLMVGFVLHEIYKNPNIRILIGSSTKPLAIAIMRSIQQWLEHPELQEYVWNDRPKHPGRLIPIMDSAGSERRRHRRDDEDDPEYTKAADKKVQWNNNAIQVNRPSIMKEPTVAVTSVGTTSTGFHFDICIFDDVVVFDNCDTPGKIQKTARWVADMVSVVKRDGGQFLFLGTRYAKDDYYGYILEKQASRYSVFSRNIYVNGTDNTDGYIWADGFTAEHEAELREELKDIPQRFASQYLNTIMSEDEIVLHEDNITWVAMEWVVIKESGLVEIHSPTKHDPVVIKPYLVIDPAISTQRLADFSVIMVGAVDTDKRLYVLDCKLGKWKPHELVDRTYELVDKWKLRGISIEAVAYQASLIDTFRTAFKRKHPIVLNEYRPKGEKIGRITAALEPLFQNNLITMLTPLSSNREFMEQIRYFPRSGVHDDVPDAMTQLTSVAKPLALPQKIQHQRTVNKFYGGYR